MAGPKIKNKVELTKGNFSPPHLTSHPSLPRPPPYIGDMYTHDAEMEEPDWVASEREQFAEFRDKNKDGKMDRDETRDWILPSDYDHAEAEAKHLVYESDANKVRPAWIAYCSNQIF